MRKRKNIFLRRICAAVLALALCSGLMTGCGRNTRRTKEVEMTAFGIDVARYQGTIDWAVLGQSGIDFAIVRLGYRGIGTGEITEDNNARFNLQEASKAGIPLGAYFFSTAISVEEAIEEAKWSAELLAKYPITYPVVYDCEGFRDPDSRQYHMTTQERTDVALAFLETIEELGYEGMFYSSKNELNEFWETERIESDYKIWVAQYPAEPYPETPESSYAGVHHMWQYTKDGRALGISQPVDLNVAYFGYDGIEPPRDPIPAETVTADVEAMLTFTDVNEAVTAKDETNLRDIPSLGEDSQVKVVLQNGETAQRIAVSADGWSKLIFEGNIYYARTDYLTLDDGVKTEFEPINDLVTAKEAVNLRTLPSVEHPDSKARIKLLNGEVVTRTGINRDLGWSRVVYNGETLYCISRYLLEVEQTP